MSVLQLVGTARSGTTIFAKALETIPGVVAIGETERLWIGMDLRQKDCSCGLRLLECPVWHQVFRNLGMSFQDPANDLARWSQSKFDVLRDLYQAFIQVTKAEVVVDSSKAPPYIARAAQSAPGAVLTIHLIRDPRGILYSRVAGWRKSKSPTPRAPDIVKVAGNWRRQNGQLAERALHSLGTTRYEDFCSSPRSVITEIAQRLGRSISNERWQDDHTPVLGTSHLLFSNPSRRSVGPTQINQDRGWSNLPPRSARLVSILCLPQSRRFRYWP